MSNEILSVAQAGMPPEDVEGLVVALSSGRYQYLQQACPLGIRTESSPERSETHGKRLALVS